MESDNNSLHQPDTRQQSSLMKKKNNLIWIVTVVPLCYLLLIANLQYLHFLYSWSDSPAFRDNFWNTASHLSGLLAVDLVAASFYLAKKSNPNWKAIFILLFMFNLTFFVYMLTLITSPYLGLALVGVVLPYFPILLVADLIAVFIKKHPHGGRAWIISYAALIAVSFVLFLAGTFIYHFYPMDLYQ